MDFEIDMDDINIDDVEDSNGDDFEANTLEHQFETVTTERSLVNNVDLAKVLDSIGIGEYENLLIIAIESYLEEKLSGRYSRDHLSELPEMISIHDVAKVVAEKFLAQYQWKACNAYQDFMDNGQAVLKSKRILQNVVGNPTPPQPNENNKMSCFVLCDEFPITEFLELPCGHYFSKESWIACAEASTDDRSFFFNLSCMHEDCCVPLPIPYSLSMLGDAKTNAKFTRLRYDGFAASLGLKPCTSADCTYFVSSSKIRDAVTRRRMLEDGSAEIICPLNHSSCTFCMLEAHPPFPCNAIVKWSDKEKDDGANAEWILAYTKLCPDCQYPIEKNKGCSHITCKCGYQFCWVCLKEWRNHTTATHANCEVPRTAHDQVVRLKVDRYLHFYEKYSVNNICQNVNSKNLHIVSLVQHAVTCCVDLNEWSPDVCIDSHTSTEMIELYQLLSSKRCSKGRLLLMAIYNICLAAEKGVAIMESLSKAYKLIIRTRRFLKQSYAYSYVKALETLSDNTSLNASIDLYHYQTGVVEDMCKQITDLSSSLMVNRIWDNHQVESRGKLKVPTIEEMHEGLIRLTLGLSELINSSTNILRTIADDIDYGIN